GREHLAMHRSGQILFLPHAKLKQREKTSTGHFLFFIAAIYMLENQTVYILCFFMQKYVCFIKIILS
ncbi:hypothetical protein, partial [Bacillus sp. AFS019443]